MKISKYVDSIRHKQIIEKIKNHDKSKELYFKQVLPIIIYTLENTSFEVKHDVSGELCYFVNTINLKETKFLEKYYEIGLELEAESLINKVADHIEKYFCFEAGFRSSWADCAIATRAGQLVSKCLREGKTVYIAPVMPNDIATFKKYKTEIPNFIEFETEKTYLK